MRCWVLLVLSLVVVGAVAGDDDLDDVQWEGLNSDTLVVTPFACDTTEFSVGRRSAYRLSLEPIDLPAECSLQDDFRTTTKVYFRGECLTYITDGDDEDCIEPSGSGIESADQLCQNWSDLDTAPYLPDHSETTVSSMTGQLCFSNKHYYVTIKSECPKTVKFRVQVDGRELTDDENEVCSLVKGFFKGVAGVAAGVVVALILVAVLVPTGCIIGGIVICCCCCPGCPCYYKRDRTIIVGQPVAQYPGEPYPSQPVPYQSVPTVSDVEKPTANPYAKPN